MTFPVSRRALLIGALPVAALGLSACGSSQNSSSSSPSASPAASSASSSVSSAASSSAATEAGSSASASASDGYVGYRLNSEVPGAGTATLYTDYQCPYCAKAEPKFEEAAKKLDGVLNVTVRHMPLDIHANAVPAALAVQAAEAQGKHVEMANRYSPPRKTGRTRKISPPYAPSSATTPRSLVWTPISLTRIWWTKRPSKSSRRITTMPSASV